MWCIPPEQDAAFVAAMEQVLAVYHRPYDPLYPVVNMDEQPIQLISHSRAPLPMRPGSHAKIDYEYVREGKHPFLGFLPIRLEAKQRVSSVIGPVRWQRNVFTCAGLARSEEVVHASAFPNHRNLGAGHHRRSTASFSLVRGCDPYDQRCLATIRKAPG
jgi:hypothetical protein